MATENLTPEEEYEQGMAEAMYCAACQAMLEQECICDFLDEDEPFNPFSDEDYYPNASATTL